MATPDPLLDTGFKYSVNSFPGDGATSTWELTLTGGYLSKDHIKAYVVDATGAVTPRTLAWTGDYTVVAEPPHPVGTTLYVYRDTPKSMPLVDFVDGAIINETNLDRNARQGVFIAAEMLDRFADVRTEATQANADAAEAKEVAAQAGEDASSALEAANAAQSQSEDTANQFEALLQTVNDLSGADLSGLARLNIPQTFTERQAFPVIAVDATTEAVEFFGNATFRSRLNGVWGPVRTLNDWNSLSNKPDAFPPSTHVHSWLSITGKPETFPPSDHAHSWGSITGKPETFAPSSHSHLWNSITDKPNVAVNGQAADFTSLAINGARVPVITVSTSAPTGGANGDIWFIVPA